MFVIEHINLIRNVLYVLKNLVTVQFDKVEIIKCVSCIKQSKKPTNSVGQFSKTSLSFWITQVIIFFYWKEFLFQKKPH